MTEDLQKCCRICLDTEAEHVSILGDPTIHLHLKSCLALSISSKDDLPKSICATCVSQLSQFYNFQLNARCSQDWLETSLEEKARKSTEAKTPIQPLPDSEYNSDSLLEFLNNTANIEEYLNNLGKEDIPSIVTLLDRNEKNLSTHIKPMKFPTPQKKENSVERNVKKCKCKIKIDVTNSELIKEILSKEYETKLKIEKTDLSCFACRAKFDNIHKLSQHMSVCDAALRTCICCNKLFDSKKQMQQHFLTHNLSSALSCNCGKQFQTKDLLIQHHKTCLIDHGVAMGCSYRCKECGKIFKERFFLYRHAREHVRKSEERICDICGHSFIGEEAVIKHKKEEHKAEDLMYRCKVCSITSSDRKEMYLHVKSHTFKQEPSRHLCESCGRSFSTHSSLLRHLETHVKIKKLQCNVCLKFFTDEKLLSDHKLVHTIMVMCHRCGQMMNSYQIELHDCLGLD